MFPGKRRLGTSDRRISSKKSVAKKLLGQSIEDMGKALTKAEPLCAETEGVSVLVPNARGGKGPVGKKR